MAEKAPKKRKIGRPSLWKDEFIGQAQRLAMLGMTNEEMAKFFGIGITTFDRWLKEKCAFRGAVKNGKEIADADVVVSLYKRATGYSHPDVHVSNYMGEVTLTPIVKHYPPDPVSMIYWLKNRQPARWRDRPTADGDDDAPPPVKIEVKVKDARVRDEKPDAE